MNVRRALCGFAVLSLLAGPAEAETVLRSRLNSDILSSDPAGRRDENTDAVVLHMVEGLVASREDGSVGPLLAQRWTVSPDGRAYDFTLRPGVFFHNGAPLTAADVVWSFQRYMKPGSQWRCRSAFSKSGIARIVSVAASSPLSVTITLDRPAPMFLKTLARADCGQTGILSRASVAADGSWIKPVGTGPFMWGAWRHNQFVDLLRFPKYASLPGPRDGNTGGKHALVDRVRFLIIPDSSAALAALERGSIDVLDSLSQTDLQRARAASGIHVDLAPTLDFYAILFQTNDSLLKDARLRRAIALSLDMPGLAKAVTWGLSPANTSPIPTASPFHGPGEALRRMNLAEAKALLAQAGYHGQPIELIANRRYPQMFDAAVLVQAMALEAGIDLEIQTLDWASQVARYSDGHYQAMSFGFSAKLDPSLNFDLLIGDKKSDPRKVWGDAAAIAQLQQSTQTGDPKQRQAIFDTLNREFMEQTPAIVMFNSTRVAASRAGVTGYKGWPAAQLRLWGVGFGGAG